jgi:hypothetical protein
LRPIAITSAGTIARPTADPAARSALSAERKPPGRVRAALGSVPTWIWVLAADLAVAIITVGRYAIADPKTICACVGTQDPAAYMWALSWWPHAIAHGLNPFVTHYLWAPTGVNVAKAAMIPAAAIVMAPITALAGPVASYNALSILGPALSAFTAYLLCKRLVHRELPAIVGGYLYGFSAYEFAQLTGHLNLTLVFLLPVIVHLALKRLDGEISRTAYVPLMTLLLVAQAGLSTELLADGVGLAALTLLLAWAIATRARRKAIVRLLLESLAAGALAMLLASPFLYYALFSGGIPKGSPNLSDVYGLDALNPLFPTYSTWLGRHDFLSLGLSYEGGNVSEADGYIGILLAGAFLAWMISAWRSSMLAQVLAFVAGVSLLAALGSHLHVAGHQTIALPFNIVRTLPVFDNIVPSRIVLFTMLVLAVGVSAWLAASSSVWRWAVVLLGSLLIAPNLLSALYGVPPRNPRFFASSTYKHYLARGETILALPFGANDVSNLWQAETGFSYYMPEGYVSGMVPSPFDRQVTVGQLVGNVPPPAPALGAFIREHHVSHVLVDQALAGPWPGLLDQLGLRGQSVQGILLYAVPGSPHPGGRA